MLEPDGRLTLLDSLRPPAGYALDLAVGTTYTLHLDALLTAPAAFALFDVGEDRAPGDLEPIELLDSIRRHADRITVFHHAGQAGVPRARRLFAYLEGAVVAVQAPNGGVFHPKVWVLRYRSRDDKTCLRILCASRNLTFDRSWDTLLRLDSIDAPGAQDEGEVPTRSVDAAEVARFLQELPELAVQALPDERADEIRQLSVDVGNAAFAAPPGFSRIKFNAIGLGPPEPPPFPVVVDRLLVVSPFLQSSLLQGLPAASERHLVSRRDQILALGAEGLSGFTQCYVLKEAADLVEPSSASSENSRTVADDPGTSLSGLHAKIFVFDQGDESTVVAGSANATSAAFARNVEMAVEMTAPVDLAGVERILDEGDKNEPGFGRLLDLIEPPEIGEPVDAPEAEVRLDQLRFDLGALRIVAEVSEPDDGGSYRVCYRSEHPVDVDLEGVVVKAWPVSAQGLATPIEIEPDAVLDVAFTVSFDSISAFLALDLSVDALSTQFVIPCRLVGAPSDRRSRLLRSLLGDASRFLRYLLMLLADEASDERFDLEALLDQVDGQVDDQPTHAALVTVPLLEAMLRALARDPARLSAVERLVDELEESVEGGELLPEHFTEVWGPIREVAAELDGAS